MNDTVSCASETVPSERSPDTAISPFHAGWTVGIAIAAAPRVPDEVCRGSQETERSRRRVCSLSDHRTRDTGFGAASRGRHAWRAGRRWTVVAVGAVLEDLVLAGRVPAGLVAGAPDRDPAGLSALPVADITADITGIHTTAIATTAIRIRTAGMALAIRICTRVGMAGLRSLPVLLRLRRRRTTRVRLFGWR